MLSLIEYAQAHEGLPSRIQHALTVAQTVRATPVLYEKSYEYTIHIPENNTAHALNVVYRDDWLTTACR